MKKLLNFFIGITLLANYATAQTPYCTTSTDNIANSEVIGRVQVGTIDNVSTGNAAYQDFLNISTNLEQGTSVDIVITGVGTYSEDQVFVWIDFNHDGDFEDAGENVFTSEKNEGPYFGNINIPTDALAGPTRMRVKMIDVTGTPANPGPCGLSQWGQVEDYTVNITPSYCTTSTNPHSNTEVIQRVEFGTIDNISTGIEGYQDFTNISTDVARGASVPINITGAGTYSEDQVFVWIDFNHDGDFTDAGEDVFTSAKNEGPYTGTVLIPADAQGGSTRMRVKMIDVSGDPANPSPCGLSDWGQVEDYTVNIPLPPYCTTSTNPHANTEVIGRVQFGMIDNTSTGIEGYQNFTQFITVAGTGSSIPFTVTGDGTYPGDQLLIWIDFNQDGDFDDAGENVYSSTPDGFEGPYTGSITIDPNALAGTTRMRVKLLDTGGDPVNPTPCGLSDWGQVEDYSLFIPNCPPPVTITTQPAATTTCTGASTSLSIVETGVGTSYQWQVSTDGGATYTSLTDDATYSGVTTSFLTITEPPFTLNNALYRVLLNGSCTISNSAVLTVNPLPSVSLGVSPRTRLFPGLTTTITATPSAGGNNTFRFFRNGVLADSSTTGILPINVDQQGFYTATVTNSLGCTSLLSAGITIADSTNNSLFITPNPSTGQFKVRLFSGINISLTRTVNVYDTKGARVYTRYYSVSTPYESMDVNMINQNPGLYIVEVGDANGNRLKVGTIIIL